MLGGYLDYKFRPESKAHYIAKRRSKNTFQFNFLSSFLRNAILQIRPCTLAPYRRVSAQEKLSYSDKTLNLSVKRYGYSF